MFTGIVEATGRVESAEQSGDITRLRIAAPGIHEGLAPGESIAVNGVCLTVVRLDAQAFEVEAIPETLRLTNLGRLAPDDGVNLERSVTPTTRLGGHFVQGHVDGLGTVVGVEPDGTGGSIRLVIEAPVALEPLLVHKGYIAVDGMSLTVASLPTLPTLPMPRAGAWAGACAGGPAFDFEVALIPYTLENTVAGRYTRGCTVNLEADILGKYVARLGWFGRRTADHQDEELA